MIDIDELVELTKKLNIADRKLEKHCYIMQTLTDLLPLMCWVKDLDEKYLFANKMVCEKLLHTDPNELIGQTDMDVARRERQGHENDLCPWHSFGEACHVSDQTVLTTGKPYRRIEKGYTKGKKMTIDVRKFPLHNKEGQLMGICGCAQIATEGERRWEDHHPLKTRKGAIWKRESCKAEEAPSYDY